MYALLLGSGISKAAKIPTGWDITLDLVRKVARLEAADCEPDPAAWFVKTHCQEADYSDLLNEICKTQAERSQLLRGYFEPTDEEREAGEKQPTAAHRAVGRLVAGGYVRVILTTNFDRLLERAIEEEAGITPTVISSAEGISGAMPLVHERCIIVKLHGDYRDVRIRNTTDELAAYDPAADVMLDRVLDVKLMRALRRSAASCPWRPFPYYAYDPGEMTAHVFCQPAC